MSSRARRQWLWGRHNFNPFFMVFVVPGSLLVLAMAPWGAGRA
jgi:hypothetical protein